MSIRKSALPPLRSYLQHLSSPFPHNGVWHDGRHERAARRLQIFTKKLVPSTLDSAWVLKWCCQGKPRRRKLLQRNVRYWSSYWERALLMIRLMKHSRDHGALRSRVKLWSRTTECSGLGTCIAIERPLAMYLKPSLPKSLNTLSPIACDQFRAQKSQEPCKTRRGERLLNPTSRMFLSKGNECMKATSRGVAPVEYETKWSRRWAWAAIAHRPPTLQRLGYAKIWHQSCSYEKPVTWKAQAG